MANLFYRAIPGKDGTLRINGSDFPNSVMSWEVTQSPIYLPTIASLPFVDVRPGSRRLVISASGVSRYSFNPFRIVNPANLGTYANISMICADNFWYAQCAYAYVHQWNFRDIANGVAEYSIVAIGNFEWSNMGGQNNA